MKQSIKLSGIIEYSKHELIGIIEAHAQRHKGFLFPIIQEHLATTNQYAAKKVQYSESGVTVAVEQDIASDPVKLLGESKPVRTRKGKSFKMRFRGFKANAKSIFAEYRKRGEKQIAFDVFLNEIRFHHLAIEASRVAIYLYDDSLGITWDAQNKIIKL